MSAKPIFLVLSAALLSLMLAALCFAQGRDKYAPEREKMVRDFLEREGISNRKVLDAMRTVPRHEFMRPDLKAKAYLDGAFSIGHKQTISPPFVVAYMTETVDPQPEDRVLEIGTGSGYQAAVLSGLVKEVYSIEIVEPLGKMAGQRLKRLRYDNVKTKVGDGYLGWPEHAPFDKIIVTCSPEEVPKPLVEQLREGGKMIIPLGERYEQVFYLLEKRNGELVRTRLIPTLFVPMTGKSEELRKVQPDPLRPEITNGGFEVDADEDGLPDHWHYIRQATLASDGAREGARYLMLENDDPGRMAQVLQGMALDGRKIQSIRVSLSSKATDVRGGTEKGEKPALVVIFYDENRAVLGESIVASWRGTSEWSESTAKIRVPEKAREAIVHLGLNGGTGRLGVDDLRLGVEE